MNASRNSITNEIAEDQLVPVEAILGTEELQRRPRRAADHETEARAIAELSQALADSPSTVLQSLADVLLKTFHAESAGVSLLNRDGDQFHWAAIAGAWSAHAGSGTPRDFGPSGEVLARGTPLLFLQPQRRYEYLSRLTPSVAEWLLAPFHVRGKPAGVIWVIAHDTRRLFDAEDLRLLDAMSSFAAAACRGADELDQGKNSRRAALNLMEDARQTHQAMERLNAELRMREAQTAADATALSKLNELGSRLWRMRSVGEGLDEMLGATIEMLGADYGNIQLLEDGRQVLTIAAQRGFRTDFLDYFREVSADDFSACGRALRADQRAIIEDVEVDASFSPHLAIARSAGFRAVQSTPMIGRDGVPLGMISTHFRHPHIPSDQDLRRLDLYVRQAADFLEHKRAEAALRTSEVRYRRLFESAKDGILVLDTHTSRITDANPYVCELLGYTPLELRGRELWEIGLFETAEASRAAVQELNRRQYLRFDDLAIHTKSGQQIDVDFVSNVYREGESTVVQCNVRDITERKRLENELRRYAADLSEADRRKNEFLAMLAHELRNPLAPIRNAARAMRLTGGDDALVSASEMLERQVGQMVRLVDDLVDVSRLSRGKIELRRHRIDMGAVVRQSVDAVRPLLQSMHHDLKLSLPPDPLFVDADATRLSQVVGNLLTNASKFTDRGGRIAVSLASEDGQAVLRVRDNGIGIAPEQLSHIFEMFMQVDVSLERSTTGLGIGLTLVKSLVEMHGGTVEARSEGPGHGTEFVVRLPAAETAAPKVPEGAHAEPAPTTRPLRILVVDDNRDSATSLAMLLQVSGNKTQVAHDGLKAVEAVKKFKPDVTLLDIGLPKLNGYEVAKRIRRQLKGKNMLLIAVTGWGQEEDRQRSREAGFDGHLVKPVDYDTLMGLLTAKVAAD